MTVKFRSPEFDHRQVAPLPITFTASLRVEFGKRSSGVLPGRVYLCAPGGQKARVFRDVLADPITMVGRFEAKLP